MKISFSHRWNGDKTVRIINIKNHKEAADHCGLNAWVDFMAILAQKLKLYYGPVSYEHELLQIYNDEYLKKYNPTKDHYHFVLHKALINYIMDSTMKNMDEIYEILNRFHNETLN